MKGIFYIEKLGEPMEIQSQNVEEESWPSGWSTSVKWEKGTTIAW